jgi:hypothetical protein
MLSLKPDPQVDPVISDHGEEQLWEEQFDVRARSDS